MGMTIGKSAFVRLSRLRKSVRKALFGTNYGNGSLVGVHWLRALSNIQTLRYVAVLLAAVVFLSVICAAWVAPPPYDLDSLVYLSTDVVVATLWEDEQEKISATVEETIIGQLPRGERVLNLNNKNIYPGYVPRGERGDVDGTRVILFLDSRSAVSADGWNPRFRVHPGGVFLIDGNGQVHDGCMLVPSLGAEKARIIKAQERLRRSMLSLLNRSLARRDESAVFALLRARAEEAEECSCFSGADAITERLSEQLWELGDGHALLKLEAQYPNSFGFPKASPSWLEKRDERGNLRLAEERANFLLRALSKRGLDPRERATAAGILGATQSPHRWVTEKSPTVARLAAEFERVAIHISADESENTDVRAACLRWLSLSPPEAVDTLKNVYRHTGSPKLRYLIADKFLEKSGELYQSLAPPSPIASFIFAEKWHGCFAVGATNKVGLKAQYRILRSDPESHVSFIPVLRNLQNKEQVSGHVFPPYGDAYGLNGEGESDFVLETQGLPEGKYSLVLEFRSTGNKVVGTSYPLALEVRGGSVIVLD
jgi:hypothetical protein